MATKNPNAQPDPYSPYQTPDPQYVVPGHQAARDALAAHQPIERAAPFDEVPAQPRQVAPEVAERGITPTMAAPLGTGEPPVPTAYVPPDDAAARQTRPQHRDDAA